MAAFLLGEYEFPCTDKVIPAGESVYVPDIEGGCFYWLHINKGADFDEDSLYSLIFMPFGKVGDVPLKKVRFVSVDNLHYMLRTELGYKMITAHGHVVLAEAEQLLDRLYYATSTEVEKYLRYFPPSKRHETQEGHFVRCALRRIRRQEEDIRTRLAGLPPQQEK